MPVEHDHAVVLRLWDWSETSQTASLLCRGKGGMRVLAKGSLRPKAPFSGGLELLTLGDAGLIIKASSELAQLTEWDLREPFAHLRRNLRAYYAGMYFADVVHHLVIDREPHPGLFDELVSCLLALGEPERVDETLVKLQWAALCETGYQPVLDQWADSEADLPEFGGGERDGPLWFDPLRGGLVRGDRERGGGEAGAARWASRAGQGAGAGAAPGGAPGGAAGGSGGAAAGSGFWGVRAGTVRAIAAVTGGLSEAVPREPVSERDVQRAGRLLAACIRHLLGVELPSVRSVFPGLPRGGSNGREKSSHP